MMLIVPEWINSLDSMRERIRIYWKIKTFTMLNFKNELLIKDKTDFSIFLCI